MSRPITRNSLAIFSAAAATLAAVPAAHAIGYYAPGSYQTPTAWDPPTATLFTDQGGGLFTLALTGLTPATKYEYKVLYDDNDIQAWGDTELTPSPPGNYWFLPDAAGNVTLRYDEGTNKASFAGDWVP